MIQTRSFGADDASASILPYGPATEKGKAAANQATMTFIAQSSPSTSGAAGDQVLKLNTASQAALFQMIAKLRGRAMTNWGECVIVPQADAKGNYAVATPADPKEPSMLALLGYWSGNTARPGSEADVENGWKADASSIIYFKWIATGDYIIPGFTIRRDPMSAGACAEAGKAAGEPGCGIFEFSKTGEKWPEDVLKLLPKKGGLKAASILGYGALGVAAAAAAIVGLSYVSKKRTAKANRARRRRH